MCFGSRSNVPIANRVTDSPNSRPNSPRSFFNIWVQHRRHCCVSNNSRQAGHVDPSSVLSHRTSCRTSAINLYFGQQALPWLSQSRPIPPQPLRTSTNAALSPSPSTDLAMHNWRKRNRLTFEATRVLRARAQVRSAAAAFWTVMVLSRRTVV